MTAINESTIMASYCNRRLRTSRGVATATSSRTRPSTSCSPGKMMIIMMMMMVMMMFNLLLTSVILNYILPGVFMIVCSVLLCTLR